MSTPSAEQAKQPEPRRLWLMAVFVGLLSVGVATWAWWPRTVPAAPPNPDLAEADPLVVDLIAEARQEVLQAPRSARAWGQLGMVFRAHDFGEESITCFKEAERLDPSEARWPYLCGLTLLLTDPDSGIPCLERAVALTDRVELRLRLVEALLEQARLEEAERHVKAVLKRAPSHPRARLGMARLAFARDDWRGGLNHLDVMVTIPTRKLIHTLRAEALHRLGEEAHSAEELKQAHELPDDAPWPDPFVEEVERLQVGVRVQLARADAWARQGRSGEAVALLEEVVKEHPDHGQAWLLLGRTLLKVSRWPLAERALAESVRAEPDSVESWFALGVARVYQRNVKGAAQAFDKVVRLKPDHTEGHFNLGLCLKDQGDRVGAARAFRQALKCQPDYEPARKALMAPGVSSGPW